MQFNLREYLSRKSDKELVIIHSRSQASRNEANRGYSEGGISTELAARASLDAELSCVVCAIVRQRVETGGEYSHFELQESKRWAGVSDKRIDRNWGRWMGERRRV